MNIPPERAAKKTATLWERPEPATRPAPSPLSREKIVGAAIAIADMDGLEAVSLRKVGASLEARPMRLYTYLSTKEELLDLMVDAVLGETYGETTSLPSAQSDWRDALRAFAHRTRQACRKHPWFIELLAGRPHLGPNALAHLETTLAHLKDVPEFDDIDAVMRALSTVKAYTVGAIQCETSELKSGSTKAQWQEAWWPYLERRIATGRFPMLARVIRDASHPSLDAVFDEGLETVLAGIETRLKG